MEDNKHNKTISVEESMGGVQTINTESDEDELDSGQNLKTTQ